MAEGRSVAVELHGEVPDRLIAGLAGLGLSARQIRPPDVDVKRVRERSGLSQADFAVRFGFELDTVQNWEQRRNAMDAATRILMAIIDKEPDVVEAALTRSPTPARRRR